MVGCLASAIQFHLLMLVNVSHTRVGFYLNIAGFQYFVFAVIVVLIFLVDSVPTKCDACVCDGFQIDFCLYDGRGSDV